MILWLKRPLVLTLCMALFIVPLSIFLETQENNLRLVASLFPAFIAAALLGAFYLSVFHSALPRNTKLWICFYLFIINALFSWSQISNLSSRSLPELIILLLVIVFYFALIYFFLGLFPSSYETGYGQKHWKQLPNAFRIISAILVTVLLLAITLRALLIVIVPDEAEKPSTTFLAQ